MDYWWSSLKRFICIIRLLAGKHTFKKNYENLSHVEVSIPWKNRKVFWLGTRYMCRGPNIRLLVGVGILGRDKSVQGCLSSLSPDHHLNLRVLFLKNELWSRAVLSQISTSKCFSILDAYLHILHTVYLTGEHF